mmetsp:Transcript_19837/g.28524  ORF Transcript_19837/g.28524 Transcript_19837/m.28524 type:complete len:339 (-) Transcript_19837:90-1106(-)
MLSRIGGKVIVLPRRMGCRKEMVSVARACAITNYRVEARYFCEKSQQYNKSDTPNNGKNDIKVTRTRRELTRARFIHVLNLPANTTKQEITDLVEKTGPINEVEINKATNSKDKLYAVVSYASAEDAESAVEQLQDLSLHGSSLDVRTTSLKDIDFCDRKRNLFVGNLTPRVTESMLYGHMNQWGGVLKAAIFTKPNGHSKCCGLVAFESEEKAVAAMENAQNSKLDNRIVLVKRDEDVSDRAYPENNSDQTKVLIDPTRSVFVTNIHYDLNTQMVFDFMSEAGTVKKVNLFRDSNGQSKGRALVEYVDSKGARNALSTLDGVNFFYRNIYIRPCNPI